jgi:hypothetical protein
MGSDFNSEEDFREDSMQAKAVSEEPRMNCDNEMKSSFRFGNGYQFKASIPVSNRKENKALG